MGTQSPTLSVPLSQALKGLLLTMRPKQWTKNLLIFAGIVFDVKLFVLPYLAKTLLAFVLFCLLSSAVYLVNDLADIEKDRQHPKKRHRPLASGELSPQVAIIATLVIMVVALPLAFWLSLPFGGIALTYVALMLAYSFRLKHIVIIDVLVVAAAYPLRAGAGTVVFPIERFSPWLYVCTLLGALLISIGKRRHELRLLENNAAHHRASLDEYSPALLDEMIAVVTSTTVIAYSLYTFSAPNLPGNHAMMLTIPFVLYGIFRYLYLIHRRNEGGSPEELFLKDRPLAVTVILWGLTVIAILYLGLS